MNYCEKCGSNLNADGTCPNCDAKKVTVSRNKLVYGVIILVIIAFLGIPYYRKVQNDKPIMAAYDAAYTSSKHDFLAAKTDSITINRLEIDQSKLMLKKNQTKASDLQKDIQQKDRMLTAVNSLYAKKVITGDQVNTKVRLQSDLSLDNLTKIQKEAKKLKAGAFKTKVTVILQDAREDTKNLATINDDVYNLLSNDNIENDKVDSQEKKIKKMIEKLHNQPLKKTAKSGLKDELALRSEAESNYQESERQASITSLSDVTSFDDLDNYNSDFRPEYLALYGYKQEYSWDGKRKGVVTYRGSSYVDGEILDSSNDDIKAYWELDDDGLLKFYSDSNRTDEKDGTANAFNDFDEDELQEFIDGLD